MVIPPDIGFSQATVLGFIQGLTEFLPISSSAHLILTSTLFDWSDQGITFDVSLHLGSLFAVLIYFRKDLKDLKFGGLRSISNKAKFDNERLLWLIIIATIPAGFMGFVFDDYIEKYTRSIIVIAASTFVFALILMYADKTNHRSRSLHDLSWKEALCIGAAQAIALIPGTSRSGITMTAALLLGCERKSAAKFSFLLAIPIILGSTILRFSELVYDSPSHIDLLLLFYGALISGIIAYGCIHYFLKLIDEIGFLPFVIYRIILAATLFFVYLN